MGKKLTKWNLEKVKMLFGTFGFIVITNKYQSMKQKLIIADSEGYYYFINVSQFLLFQTPRKVHKTNPYSIQNINHWIKLNNKSFKLLSDTYEGNDKLLNWKCLKCEEEFENSWNHISSQDQGCPYCTGQKVCLSNCLATNHPNLIEEWHSILNGDVTPYDVTCGSGKQIWWKCKECNYEWEAAIFERSNGNGCPECNKSKGEKKIDEVLINKKFVKISYEEFEQLVDSNKYYKNYFISQKKFEDLIGLGNGLLSYDHYIPKLNLLIEYDGVYHYRPIRSYKGEPIEYAEKRLKKQKIHDEMKNKYAENNNIKLLRIPYWEFDNIESILKENII